MNVVVVGAGITGLTAAHALAADGIDVEVREADERVGGKLLTSPFAGLPAVDEGADAFLARVPAAVALARAVGLDLTEPTGARAAVWHDGLHDLPDGLLMGVPTDAIALARSRLLTTRGKLRAALEPLLPRRDDPGEDAIGPLIRRRFGHEVQERLVDALVGSIYGADTDRFSLTMVPQIAVLAGAGGSLTRAAIKLRAQAPPTSGPIFHTPLGGMGSFAGGVAEAARQRGVRIRTGCPVHTLGRDGAAWRVDDDPADAVVLAIPAAAAAPLVAGVAPDAATALATQERAGVVIVTVAQPDWPERLRARSGYLVPKPDQRTVTAVSFGSQKWAHWRSEQGEVLRISLGRDGLPTDHLSDDVLVDRAIAETGAHLGVDLQPSAVRVSRWPNAFPQYRPGHRGWVESVASGLPAGLHAIGASYDGIGVPACITQALALGDRVRAERA